MASARHHSSSWRRFVPAAVCLVVSSLAIGSIVTSEGFPIHDAVLDDGGVWVTDDSGPFYGRVSVTATAMDMLLNPPGKATEGATSLDVFQEGDSIIARIVSAGLLLPVDPRTGINMEPDGVAVPPTAHVAEGGGSTKIGSLAVLDPATGELRAIRFMVGSIPDLSGLDPTSPVLATLPTGSTGDSQTGFDVTVGVDGTVYAVSTSGEMVTLVPDGYVFGNPETTTIAEGLSSAAITVVGTTPIVADPVAGVVYLPSGQQQVDKGFVLQQAGPESTSVLIATKEELLTLPLDGADARSLTDKGTGDPAHPVSLSGCSFGAWAGEQGVVARVCGDSVETSMVDADHGEQGNTRLIQPEFRVNRGRILLNDLATGRIYDIDTKQSIEEWSKIQPYEKPEIEQVDCSEALEGAVTQAQDETMGVRPNRMTALYVLDNDTGLCGQSLSIISVSDPDKGSISISPDAQTLLVNLPADTAPQTMEYTIQDVSGHQATARVTAEIHEMNVNALPYHIDWSQRGESAHEPYYPVASQSAVSVPVSSSWRDPDGDPVTIKSATLDGLSLPVTPQGLIRVVAPRVTEDTVKEVTYEVTDGIGASVEGSTSVTVLGDRSITGVPPQAMPDAVRGKVGVPIPISPLANDVPGSDPLHPDATLALGASVGSLVDVTVQTDVLSGIVTATADKPGSYPLSYTASFGPTLFAQGTIRLDIAEEGNDLPVAIPDSVAIRGDAPVTVDLLANDVDPAGNVLTVQSATLEDPSQMQVAIYEGRWLKIKAVSDHLSPNPQVIHYTVTNGLALADSDVVVTQLPAVDPDRAIITGDYASVRAGDQVMIPVLDNDVSESGSPLVISDNVQDMAAGTLQVTDSEGNTDPAIVGKAVVVGDHILFLAPPMVDAPTEVTFDYQAGVALQTPATGSVRVTINPASEINNHKPTPKDVEVRAVAGETVTIPIATYGVDDDGDSVTVVGLGSAPKYGRVTTISVTSLTYEAFPSQQATGSDWFTYVVTDQWGATGTATVRIGLASPGQVQPPVAVDDVVTASYGSAVEIHPKTNDLIPVGDTDATLAPLTDFGNLPTGVTQNPDYPQIVYAAAPASVDDPAVVVPYALVGSGGVGPSGSMIIRGQEGYNNPPRVYDHNVVTTYVTTADVDVLDNAWDIDGKQGDLKVTAVGTGGTILPTGHVEVTLTDRMHSVWFEVTDKLGGVSAAVIYVPAPGQGRPYLKQDGMITMAGNSTATVDINDYIVSPRGTQVRLTTSDMVSTAPAVNLSSTVTDESRLVITSANNYAGPGALNVEVVDSADPNDPAALRGVVSIPIQVGEPSPIMWCPDDVITVVPGGSDVPVDVAALCRVWTPDGIDPSSLSFTASWSQLVANVSITSGHTLTFNASGVAAPGSVGTVDVVGDGYPELHGTLNIQVGAARKPTMAVANITDVQQGSQVSTAIVMQSVLKDRQPTIVSVEKVSGPDAEVTWNGLSIRVTPGSTAHGVITFHVVASDVADTTRTDRQVQGSFTVTVFGKPDSPDAPQPDKALRSHSAIVTYRPSSDNGAPIDNYEIQWTGGGTGSKSCGLSTRCEVKDLMNGLSYKFQVRAHNKAGWSEWSSTGQPVIPDEVPGTVSSFDTSSPTDGSLLLTWAPAVGEWSAVTQYTISYGNKQQVVPGTQSSLQVTGLDNMTPYTFTIVAENQAGISPHSVSVSGQSSGIPGAPGDPVVTYADLGSKAQVTVSWKASSPNGPGPVIYHVLRHGGTGPDVDFGNIADTKILDTVPYDGQTYTYTVSAVNGVNVTKPASADSKLGNSSTVTWVAVGAPAAWEPGALTVSPTGANGGATLTVKYPASRGKTGSLQVTAGGKTQTINNLAPAGGTQTIPLSGLTNGSDTAISVVECNESNACTPPVTTSVRTFGPLTKPTISVVATSVLHQLCVKAVGDGNAAGATLAISAQGFTTQSSKGTAQITTSMCVDAGKENTTVAFTATLTSDPVTPSRATPPVATISATTPWDPLDPPTITVKNQTSKKGDYNVCVTATAQARSNVLATLTVSSPQNSSFTKTAQGTTTISISQCWDVKTPSTGVTFFAQVSDDKHGKTNSVSANVTTNPQPDPYAKPVIRAYNQTNNPGDYRVCVEVSAKAIDGDEAKLTVTSTPNVGEYMVSGTTNLSDSRCFTLANPGTDVTFTAVVADVSGDLHHSAQSTATVTTNPEPLPLGKPGITGNPATATKGDFRVCVTATAQPLEGTVATLTVLTQSGGTVATGKGGSGTVTAEGCVDLLGPNISATFTTSFTDGVHKDAPANSVTVKSNAAPDPPPLSPLGKPGITGRTATATKGDYRVCVTATAQPLDGTVATLTVLTQSGGSVATDKGGTGTLTADGCVDLKGANISATFTTSFTDGVHKDAPANSVTVKSNPAPDPTYDPKVVSVSKGSQTVTDGNCPDGCQNVIVQVSGYSADVTCTLYYTPYSTGKTSTNSWTQGPNSTFDTLNRPANVSHYFGFGKWTVTCKDTNGLTASKSGEWPH